MTDESERRERDENERWGHTSRVVGQDAAALMEALETPELRDELDRLATSVEDAWCVLRRMSVSNAGATGHLASFVLGVVMILREADDAGD